MMFGGRVRSLVCHGCAQRLTKGDGDERSEWKRVKVKKIRVTLFKESKVIQHCISRVV